MMVSFSVVAQLTGGSLALGAGCGLKPAKTEVRRALAQKPSVRSWTEASPELGTEPISYED